MSEYIYETDGKPMRDVNGNISLARVRIVRCRDCREYHPELYRTISCELLGRYVEPNWFCCSGEREERFES